MNILWASRNNDVVIISVMVSVFVLVFVGLFLLNMFTAKYKITFYVDGLDVAKIYVKYKAAIVLPEELKALTWYTDPECTIPFNQEKMGLKELQLYTKTPTPKKGKAKEESK